ncbi:MAG TPA: hypothetical protein VG079_07065 [Gaiellaceae bacterium]|nr:hypothetical protein [Gaiellaceae bacterium]
MFDGLTGRYTFSCPNGGEARVPLSAFRTLERLPGAAHPAVYKVLFACACGEEHEALLTHEALDWTPLTASDASFFNLMTSRFEPVLDELLDRAAALIRAGVWPWSFFCYPEGGARPTFPSAFRLLAAGGDEVGVAVRCPSCEATSVNFVTRRHVDEPFFHDRHVTVVEHVFASDREETLAAFRAEFASGSFDARPRDLAA